MFATTSPPYLDKTNATAIHAALGLPTADGSVRHGGVGAQSRPRRGASPACRRRRSSQCWPTSAPASPAAATSATAATRQSPSSSPVRSPTRSRSPSLLGGGAATDEFLDRWRMPGETASRVWEERFGEHAYVPLAESAITDALKSAGVTPSELDHVIVDRSPLPRGERGRGLDRCAARGDRRRPHLGDRQHRRRACEPAPRRRARPRRARPDHRSPCCSPTAPMPWCCARPTRSSPTATVGATTVAEQIAAGRDDLGYPTFLTWRGLLHREPPRRPDPERPAAPPSLRTEPWKFGFVGSRCDVVRHPPPSARPGVRAAAVRSTRWMPERLADMPGHDRHLHDRPAGVLAQPARGGRR